MHTLKSDPFAGESKRMDLIREMLGVMAVAEQQIADQKRRIDYLESLAMTDELTALVNRRGFEDFLHRTLAAATRYKETGIIAYVDLDNFKQVNDQYGHAAGDKVLYTIASILKDNVRASDLVARLGGDEFVVMLVRCGIHDGRKHIDRLTDLIEEAVIEHDGQQIGMRASIGVEPYGPNSKAKTLISRADAAMYRRKRERSLPTV
jgi:diguanylate cyclase (GGDEF)-like protein